MRTVYIAHRLFALHDRVLASELAYFLKSKKQDIPLFLPYCDTNEDTIIAEKKGLYLFERDIERLRNLAALIAILHGPGYDDGVCMEIGFAFCTSTPLVFFTTDFLTYSFGSDQRQFVFADPLLEILGPRVIRITDPYPNTTQFSGNHYYNFQQRNAESLRDALHETCRQTFKAIGEGSEPRVVGSQQKLVYIEPSPYYPSNYFNETKAKVERRGWDCYIAKRLQKPTVSVELAARMDLKKALQSSVLILDGNGPEVPIGAALLTGIGLAMNKTTLLYYMGTQITHAHGREENARNLMLLYGCSFMACTFEQLQDALIVAISR